VIFLVGERHVLINLNQVPVGCAHCMGWADACCVWHFPLYPLHQAALGVDEQGTKMMAKDEIATERRRTRSFSENAAAASADGASLAEEGMTRPRSRSFLEFLFGKREEDVGAGVGGDGEGSAGEGGAAGSAGESGGGGSHVEGGEAVHPPANTLGQAEIKPVTTLDDRDAGVSSSSTDFGNGGEVGSGGEVGEHDVGIGGSDGQTKTFMFKKKKKGGKPQSAANKNALRQLFKVTPPATPTKVGGDEPVSSTNIGMAGSSADGIGGIADGGGGGASGSGIGGIAGGAGGTGAGGVKKQWM
jgi:hypothetical protein